MRVLLSLSGTILLLLLASMLGAVAKLSVSSPDLQLPSVLDLAETRVSDPVSSTKVISRPELAYHTITERPIFSPTRRPQVAEIAVAKELPMPEPEIVADVPPKPTPPQVRLFGTMLGDGRALALLGNPDEVPAWVRSGEVINGWTVSKIEPDRATLMSGTETITLELYTQ